MPRLLSRAVDRLRTESAQTVDVVDHRHQGRPIASVHGVLRSVLVRPTGGGPSLEAELHDGTRSVVVIWLGRRAITGVAVGRRLMVHGRLGQRSGQPVMYNPRYELEA